MIAVLVAISLGYGTPNCIGNPPERYQGDVTVTVHFESEQQLAKDCGGSLFAACSTGHEMWVRNACKANEASDLASLASDLCHELGHINGWPGNHPR